MNELPLGLRIYDSLEKQKRWKFNLAKGVKHLEYQYCDNCDLPPWQYKRISDPAFDMEVYVLCSDNGNEIAQLTIDCPDAISNIEIATVGEYDYITYPATHDCCGLGVFVKTKVYLKITDGVGTYYSEEFWIDPATSDLDTYYRIWLPGGVRSSDPDDLRIWR